MIFSRHLRASFGVITVQLRSNGIGANRDGNSESRQDPTQVSVGALALSPNESHFEPSVCVRGADALRAVSRRNVDGPESGQRRYNLQRRKVS